MHIFTNNFKETNLKSLFYIYRNWCLVSSTSKGNSYDRNRENLLILDVCNTFNKDYSSNNNFPWLFKDFSIKYSFPWLLKTFILKNKNPWIFQDSMTRTNPVLVTKYQISAINSYWEKCDEKYIGWMDGWTEVKQYTPPPFGERGYNKRCLQVRQSWGMKDSYTYKLCGQH